MSIVKKVPVEGNIAHKKPQNSQKAFDYRG
jgi:hypothetical protein